MSGYAQEFVYQIAARAGGSRPGSHPSGSHGGGLLFAAHARLFDRPDPRRIDLRASINSVPREWLVRTNYQPAAVNITAMVDVSASMQFGSTQNKLDVSAEFLAALGLSAHRVGDSVSLMAFDNRFRDDLFLPARRGPGVGFEMASAIAQCRAACAPTGGADGLAECIERISSKLRLLFIVSDFHWPLGNLTRLLERLAGILVVPLVIWDPAEIEAPAQNGLLSLYDAESGAAKSLWLRRRSRRQWRENSGRRRAQLSALFAAREIRPLFIDGAFQTEQLSRYFLEQTV